ncbi:MAG TPA: hypothetical protein VF883_25460 [Thermoanaerobaculia bacterium]|jgi:hypothetical protein
MKRFALAVLLLTAACTSSKTPILVPHPAPHEQGRLREQWMFEQRAYPFDSIPADARRNALREVERDRANIATNAESTALTWKPIGPQPVQTNWPFGVATGRVKALAISPADPEIVLAGSSSGGIWRSTDGGASFAPVSDDHADLAVGAISFAPSSPNVVYAAMGSDFLGTGVLRSDDSGATWRLVSGNTYGGRGTAPRLVVHPTNPNRLWVAQYSRLDAAGTLRSAGILYSEDGGATWRSLLGGLASDLTLLPGTTSTLLAGMYRVDGGAGNPGIYRSTNGGATWTPTLDLGTEASGYSRIAVTPANPERAYAHVFSSGPSGEKYRVMVSDNSGGTWREVPAVGLAKEYSVFVAADPANPLVLYVGLRDLYKSIDGGQTFMNMTRGYSPTGRFDPRLSTSHVDQHSMAFDPRNANTLYLGNDGGVFRSHDAAVTFKSLSGTLSLVQAYGIAAHPTDPSAIFLGTQDNGLERRDANGEWRELITGDYGSILFDANDSNTIATNYVYGYIMAFEKRGDVYRETLATNGTFEEGGDEITRIAFIAPFEQSRASNTLFFGTYRLFLSRDFGKTWSAPAGTYDLTRNATDRLSAIGVSPSDARVIYTGSQRGRVMVTRDEGLTWTDITKQLPNRSLRAIAIDPANPNVAYIGFSGYATDHVFLTRNGGATWETLAAGLPDIPVNALLIRGDSVYAGTDIGVFRWDGARWTYFNQGMPPVIVTDFDVTANGTVIAATHGRGAYQLVAPPAPSKRRSARH